MNLIDIASHQAGMDLPGLFRQNPALDGVIIKAGSGTGYVNPYFKGWADWLHANGKPLGAFHYCRELTAGPGTPEAEAKHFYDIIKPYIGSVVPAADFERDNSDALMMGTGWLKAFLDAFYKLSGVKPLVYCSQSVTQEHDFKAIAAAGYRLWMAQYADMNPVHGFVSSPWHKGSVAPFNGYVMQQYTSQGYLEGWGKNLDFDLFLGSTVDWADMAAGSTPAPTPAPVPAGKKGPDPLVINEVLKGVYGNGRERAARLNAAGYDADAVQRKVNELYGIALSCKKKLAGSEDYLNSICWIVRSL